MQITPNPVIEKELLDVLRARYITTEGRAEGIHLSDLIYCLTKSYHRITDPLPATDQEVMLFSLGFGLENMLLRDESRVSPGCKDGIHYSPDFIPLTAGRAELKTTRASTTRDLPETWVEQIKGYAYAEGLLTYDLVVLHMLGNYKPPFPVIKGYQLTFSQEELVEQWQRFLSRRFVLDTCLHDAIPPDPLHWCKDWECKYCTYRIRCGLNKEV